MLLLADSFTQQPEKKKQCKCYYKSSTRTTDGFITVLKQSDIQNTTNYDTSRLDSVLS